MALAAPSREVALHGKGLAMRRVVARVADRAFVGTWRQTSAGGDAVAAFAEPLPAGPVTLAFAYDAAFNDHPAGLFHLETGGAWYSWSQFEATDARAAFPSFDEPGFKTPFTVTLRTPSGLVAVSNAPELAKSSEGGLDVHRFAPTPPLPTYLVAMMTGPFAVAEGAVPPHGQRDTPLPLRVLATRENAGKLDYALDGSRQIVRRLEDWFGEPFPFPKLDQIASPIVPGAMENAGADLYNEEALIVGENATPDRKREFGRVVAHELGHQWFGDLVTPKWWDDIWLNESFANWIGYRIGHEWRPELHLADGVLEEGFAAMRTDELAAGRPIRQPVASSAQIVAAFDPITYGKGGHVLAMIAGFIGEERFRAGVRRHLAAHRFGSAASDDFFAALAEAAGDPRIVPALRGFTDQQGVPLLTFAAEEGGAYTVTQSRYAPLGADMPPARWAVPLCVRRGGAKGCSIHSGVATTVLIEGAGALMPNAGGAGYYRFELPPREWDALIARAAQLPAGEALALADSLEASFRAGRASAKQLVTLAKNLSRNPDSRASGVAMAALARLGGEGILDDAALRGLRAFAGKLYAPLLDKEGFDPRLGAYARDPPERAQRRMQAISRLASSGTSPELFRALTGAARAWLGGNAAALDPAWYRIAFDSHIAAGGLDAAKALTGRALASSDETFRAAALDSVAGSGREAIARWLLDNFADPRLRASEKREALTAILSSRPTRELGYDWVVAHLDELLTVNAGIFFSSRLPQMLSGFCSAERADILTRELRPRLAGKPGELELERAIERVRNCTVLKDVRGKEISEALARLK